MRALSIVLLVALTLSGPSARAAEPPDTVNYQAVLRDDAGNPLDGSHDMVFRFFDLAAGGAEILVDEHRASGSGAVIADGGLISVALGGGIVSDGAGAGTYTTLAAVFRDFGTVWLQVEVGAEVLSPRVEILAAPYAHNTSNLGGRAASEFIDTALGSQVKAGDLTVRDLTLSGSVLGFGSGFRRLTYSGGRFELNDDAYISASSGFSGDPLLELHDTESLFGEPALRFSTTEGSADLSWDSGGFDLGDSLSAQGAVTASGLVRAGTVLESRGTVYVNSDGPDADGIVFFYEAGSASGESLRWDDSADRFDFSDEVFADQVSADTFYASSTIFPQLELHEPAPTSSDPQPGIQFSVSDGSKVFSWRPAFGYFRLTDDLLVDGYVDVQTNLFAADVRADNNIYINNNGPDANSQLNFYDGGSTTGEWIRWDDAADRFRISDEVKLDAVEIEGRDGGNFEVVSNSSLHLVAPGQVRTMIDSDDSTTTNLAEWFHDGAFNNANKIAELRESGLLRIRGTLSQNYAFDLAESFLASEPLAAGEVVALDPARPGAVRRAAGPDDTGVLGVVSSAPGLLLGSAPFDPGQLAEVWGVEQAAHFEAERGRLRREVLEENPDLRARLDLIVELQAATVEATLEAEDAGNPAGPTGPSVADAGADSTGAAADEEGVADDPALLRAEIETRLTGLALERFHAERTVPVALAGRVPVLVDASGAAIRPGDVLSAGPVPGTAVRALDGAVVIGTALEGLDAGTGAILAFVHRGGPATTVAPSANPPVASGDEPGPATAVTLPEVQTAGHLQLVLDADADDEARLSVFRDGERRLGSEVFRVDERGNVFARGAFRPASMDVAEYFATDGTVTAGDVLCVAAGRAGRVQACREAAATAVIGVVAESPGVLLGGDVSRIVAADAELAAELELARERDDREAEARIWARLEGAFLATHAPVAMTGTVEVKVDAGYGAVRPGDALASSSTPGHAMRADDPAPLTVIGKALEPLESGTGRIRMLVIHR